MGTDNVATARLLIEQIWNKGNFSGIEDMVSAKYVGHDPMFGDSYGVEGEKQHVTALRSAFPDFTVRIEDIGLAGDKVFVRWVASGTHRGPLFGIPATNRAGTVSGITIRRFEAGKVVETWFSWDTYGFLQNLGIAPALDKLAKAEARAVVQSL